MSPVLLVSSVGQGGGGVCNHISSKNFHVANTCNDVSFSSHTLILFLIICMYTLYFMYKPSASFKIYKILTFTMLTQVHKHSQDTVPIRERSK